MVNDQNKSENNNSISEENKITPPRKKLDIDSSTINRLDAHITSQNTVPLTNFSDHQKKHTGVSEGFRAKNADGKTNMLKHAYLTHQDAQNAYDDAEAQGKSSSALDDRKDFVREYIMGDIYRKTIYDRAPRESLVTDRDNNAIYLRSEYLPGSKTLAEFSPDKDNEFAIDPGNTNLKKIDIEKVVAISHVYGDLDYGNPNNIMVLEDNKTAKIDHGRSFIELPHDFGFMAAMTDFRFTSPQYNTSIMKGNLNFDIEKYSDSLKNILSTIGDGEYVNNIIDKKIDELKKSGFDVKGLELPLGSDSGSFMGGVSKNIVINNYEDLRKFFKDNFKQHLVNLNEIAEDAAIVSKYDKGDKFKRGGWIEEIGEAHLNEFGNGKKFDPIQYAIQKNIKIAGQDPREWAEQSGYKLDEKGYRIHNPKTSNIDSHDTNIGTKWEKTDKGWVDSNSLKKMQESKEVFSKNKASEGKSDAGKSSTDNIGKSSGKNPNNQLSR